MTLCAPLAPHSLTGATLVDWLRTGGARVDLEIREGADRVRGVVATRTVGAGHPLLVVPRALLLTRDVAAASDVGRELAELGGVDAADSQMLLAAFLLVARAQPGEWRPYIDALPAGVPPVPSTYTDAELALLTGSYLHPRAIERREVVRAQFARVRSAIPSLAQCSYADFLWARTLVPSRAFMLSIGGTAMDVLVPMGDMLNHQRPPDVVWDYDESAEAFVMTARRPLAAGEAVHDSYGAKCNGRLLQFYGFCLEHNRCNEAVVHFPERDFRLCADPTRAEEADCRKFLAVLLGGVSPLSETDPRVSRALAEACTRSLSAFEGTIEGDEALLRGNQIGTTTRLCITMRLGEKRTLAAVRDRALRGATHLPETA